MNAKILCEEYAELASFVQDHKDKIFGGQIVRETRHVPTPQVRPTADESSIGQDLSNRTNNHKRHSNRQNMILGLFSKKDRISIKDAASSIEGCSEKTIQREIMSLVDDGVLIKEGERRWSTYRKAGTP
jgi:predicted HTH transcriptional regulator